MPARVVVVHDDVKFTSALVERFGPDVAVFRDPVKALTALKAAKSISFLVARMQFDDLQPVGLSLARMARAARPNVRVVFTGRPAHRAYARGLGEFLTEPVEAGPISLIVEWMEEPDEEPTQKLSG